MASPDRHIGLLFTLIRPVPEIDAIPRRLEIELAALRKDEEDNVGKNTKSRMRAIEKDIAELRESVSDLEVKWKNEKEVLSAIAKLKKEIDQLKAEAESAEARADLARAAEIRYGKLPQLEGDLEKEQKKLTRFQRSRRILKEEVTEVDIAQVVSKWTGVPVSRMLEEEAKKLARMEEELKSQVVGQDEAVRSVSDAVKRSRVGIAEYTGSRAMISSGLAAIGRSLLSQAQTVLAAKRGRTVTSGPGRGSRICNRRDPATERAPLCFQKVFVNSRRDRISAAGRNAPKFRQQPPKCCRVYHNSAARRDGSGLPLPHPSRFKKRRTTGKARWSRSGGP